MRYFGKDVAIATIFYLLLAGFIWVSVSVDLAMNPWIRDQSTNWHWWNFFTTAHYLAALYSRHGGAVVFLTALVWMPFFGLAMIFRK